MSRRHYRCRQLRGTIRIADHRRQSDNDELLRGMLLGALLNSGRNRGGWGGGGFGGGSFRWRLLGWWWCHGAGSLSSILLRYELAPTTRSES